MPSSNQKQLDRKVVKLLLTPSWLSGLIAVSGGLIVVIGVVVAFAISTSHFSLQLLRLQATNPSPVVTLPAQANTNGINNSLSTTWPLIVFWGVLGLIVYFFVENIINAFKNVSEFSHELSYVNAKRDLIIKTTVENLSLRIVAAIVWLVFLNLFFKVFIPFAITRSHSFASHVRSWHGIESGLLAFIVIVLALHLNAILTRLIFRRPRLLSKAYYLD